MDNEAKEVFVNKVDAFAATLEPQEQAMLVELLVGDDEVTGFGAGLSWPGLTSLLEDAGIGNVSTVGGGSPSGVFVPGSTYTFNPNTDSPTG